MVRALCLLDETWNGDGCDAGRQMPLVNVCITLYDDHDLATVPVRGQRQLRIEPNATQ